MTKQKYQKPSVKVNEAYFMELLVTGSVKNVTTTGLGDDNLNKGDDKGDLWGDAMGKRRGGLWKEDEEEW